MTVSVELKHDVITDLHLTGDFLPLCDAREAMLRQLRGKRLDEVADALNGCNASQWILNLTNEQLITLLTTN